MRIYFYLLMFWFPLMVTASSWADKDEGKTKSKKYDYVMTVDRSAMAVVDSNVVVSLQLTAIQDVPMAQSIIIAPELTDTATQQKAEFPLIFINSRNQQIYFERELKYEFPDAMALQKKKGEDQCLWFHILCRVIPIPPGRGPAGSVSGSRPFRSGCRQAAGQA